MRRGGCRITEANCRFGCCSVGCDGRQPTTQLVHTCSTPCVLPVMMSPRSCRARGWQLNSELRYSIHVVCMVVSETVLTPGAQRGASPRSREAIGAEWGGGRAAYTSQCPFMGAEHSKGLRRAHAHWPVNTGRSLLQGGARGDPQGGAGGGPEGGAGGSTHLVVAERREVVRVCGPPVNLGEAPPAQDVRDVDRDARR